MNILTLIPVVIQAVKAIEELLPNSAGAEKLKAVIDTIEAIYGTVLENVPAMSKFISAVVSIANALGVFKKKAA